MEYELFNQLVFFTGGMLTICGFIYKLLIKPLLDINSKIDDIRELDKAYKVMAESILAIMNNLITHNNVDKLKEQRDKMESFLINK